MIETSSGLPQYSLRQSSEIFREMFGNARVAFGAILENLGKKLRSG